MNVNERELLNMKQKGNIQTSIIKYLKLGVYKQMFKKNPTRPQIMVQLKKTVTGYKLISNDSLNLFVIKRITRAMYRRTHVFIPADLIQGANMHIQNQGMTNSIVSSTIIQPPSHVTIPSFTCWFDICSIHLIQKQAFPEFFRQDAQHHEFSFNYKNSQLYKYYRNVMIGMWRENAKKYLSPVLCRRNLLGDVSSIIRIHGFLQNWGLINFPSRQHNKGFITKKPQKLQCFVCETSKSQAYYVAAIEEVLFQICEECYEGENYPLEIQKQQFIKIYKQNYKNEDKIKMSNQNILRMLDILNAAPIAAGRDREAWLAVQKEFPQYTKQQLVQFFLRIPLNIQMNSNIFQNNEDLSIQQQNQSNIQQPSIFQDYQNPIQSSIAVSYYKWKTCPTQYPQLDQIFRIATIYANQTLAKDQQDKIEELTKMLVDVSFSKLQLKSLYINEYEKLIEQYRNSKKKIIGSNMAESLKLNFRFIEKSEQPEQIKYYNGKEYEIMQ